MYILRAFFGPIIFNSIKPLSLIVVESRLIIDTL